ncbi:MAG TPA: FtsX-like permease family protein [Ignavibacteriaceae bacterium]|nr:FtsX-like permease family protein [Ignavibacteriaceae bacterium]
MIKFLIKGMLRDHHRSLFPIIVVAVGVLLTTVVYSYINGEMNDLINSNARFETGQVKVITQAFNKAASQLHNNLSLTRVTKLIESLNNKYPEYEWVPRIRFAGLLDQPDEKGETKAQRSVFGLAVNILGKNFNEKERLNLDKSIIRGRIPEKHGEILIGEELAHKIGANLGQSITLLSTNSGGSIAVQNFIICGTIKFGVSAMDRGAMIADISDLQYALEMPDGATEILGFNKSRFYNTDEAEKTRNNFNSHFFNSSDRFSPVMLTLGDQNGLNEYIQYVNIIGLLIVGIFLITMSIVLLNTGLMSGIRRYGEVGMRLALGETKDRIYKSLLYESLVIGFTGSMLGTILGLAISLYLQEHGIDISGTLRNSSIMMPNLLRSKISFTSFYIGFIPGSLATIIGTTFSGIQIFKRQTASLFKELEV